MPTYNFKAIGNVPTAKDFIDIVLSKTQRGTPTQCHNGWAIQRIRQFYMRKVKFTQQNWNEKISTILDQFPKIEEIHPFYGDLLNVLYDRDHYKLALGQLNMARGLIDKVSQDYVRLLKYGDSLYRCKTLKRAALGRMCTLMKKMGASLAYLEQVRQHMGRLPSIDPNTRTLLVCGYPNVGKSSFINKITRADVEVQPYAFTTKSLYVGHMDYKYLRWQVIDTPGILDRPLEERNTIEMQSITALAHLRACVLYVVDISEQCGYSLAQQAALFHSIKPLFSNKPVLIVCNKIDTVRMEDLAPESRALVEEMSKEATRISNGGLPVDAETERANPALVSMSTLTEVGVMEVKQAACDRLLNSRVELKLKTKKVGDVLNRMHVALPAHVDPSRPPVLPPNLIEVRKAKEMGYKRKTEKEVQEEMGGAGVYSADDRKRYMLDDPEWKYDVMPEIWDGHNIADFVDPDIDAKLEALEREEDALAAEWEARVAAEDEDLDELDDEEEELLDEIKTKKKTLVTKHRERKARASNNPIVPRSAPAIAVAAGGEGRTSGRMARELGALGMDTSKAVARVREQSRGRKRDRSESKGAAVFEDMEEPGEKKKRLHSKPSRSLSRGRSASLAAPRANMGLRDAEMVNKAFRLQDVAQRKRNKLAKVSESDRAIQTKMPKHLFSGKRGIGKTDRR